MNGQVNVLVALSDMGPGAGATMVIPGSHKSNFPPPDYEMHGHRTRRVGRRSHRR